MRRTRPVDQPDQSSLTGTSNMAKRQAGLAAERPMRERDRLSQIAVVFGRHGLRGLATRLGIAPGREDQPAALSPMPSSPSCASWGP